MSEYFAKMLQFLHLNPGAGFFVLACLLTAGRKVARHYWGNSKGKDSKYTLKDLKKYPFEALELGLILLAIIISIYYLFIK